MVGFFIIKETENICNGRQCLRLTCQDTWNSVDTQRKEKRDQFNQNVSFNKITSLLLSPFSSHLLTDLHHSSS